MLEKGGPYPQVILPQFGGYWIEDAEAPLGTPTSSDSSFCDEEENEGTGLGGEGGGGGLGYRLESNSTARAYRKHFLGRVSINPIKLTGLSFTTCVSTSLSYVTRNNMAQEHYTVHHPILNVY